VIFEEQINDNPFSSSEQINPLFFEQSLLPTTFSYYVSNWEGNLKVNPEVQFEPSILAELSTEGIQNESPDVHTSVPDVSTSTDNKPTTPLLPMDSKASIQPAMVQSAPNSRVGVLPYSLRTSIPTRQWESMQSTMAEEL
jgi:hypothetical protein